MAANDREWDDGARNGCYIDPTLSIGATELISFGYNKDQGVQRSTVLWAA